MSRRIYLILIIPAILLAGCNKWLDVKPKTQVEQDKMFSTEKGFQDAMYGAYTVMAYPSLYGDNLTMSFLDVLAQRYNCQNVTTHTFYQAAKYNYLDAGVKARFLNIWDSMYYTIANLNNILAAIDGHKDLFQNDNYRLIKGEALGMRAFLHFDLLRMFGPSYASNPTKPCIPYVTTISGGVTPLSTVSDVLDKVLTDLNAADSLLSGYKNIDANFTDPAFLALQNQWLSYRQFHFNYWAAEATMARVYLYKGDKQNALLHATNVINSGQFRFVTTSDIINYKDRTFVHEQIFSLSRYGMQSQVANYFQSASSTTTSNSLTNTYSNTGVVGQIYEVTTGGSTDFRYVYGWLNSSGVYFPAKFWQDAPRPVYNNVLPLIRIPEMYYIAAECTDPVTATNYLNTVRLNRGLNALATGLNAVQVQAAIFQEYQKEFYCEGQLFYYYKRLNLPGILYTSTPMSDKIYVFPLPDGEVQFGNR